MHSACLGGTGKWKLEISNKRLSADGPDGPTGGTFFPERVCERGQSLQVCTESGFNVVFQSACEVCPGHARLAPRPSPVPESRMTFWPQPGEGGQPDGSSSFRTEAAKAGVLL